MLCGHTWQWLSAWKALGQPHVIGCAGPSGGCRSHRNGIFVHVAFFLFWEQVPSRGMWCERLLIWVSGAHPSDAKLGGRETSLQKPDMTATQDRILLEGSAENKAQCTEGFLAFSSGPGLHILSRAPRMHWCPKSKGQAIFPAHPSHFLGWFQLSARRGVWLLLAFQRHGPLPDNS